MFALRIGRLQARFTSRCTVKASGTDLESS